MREVMARLEELEELWEGTERRLAQDAKARLTELFNQLRNKYADRHTEREGKRETHDKWCIHIVQGSWAGGDHAVVRWLGLSPLLVLRCVVTWFCVCGGVWQAGGGGVRGA